MRNTAIAAITVLLSTGAACAADLGGSYKDPPVMVNMVPNWAGLYIGAGAGFGTGKSTDKDLTGLYSNHDVNLGGAIYGAYLGYNWQRGPMVFGLEAGFNGTNIDGTEEAPSANGGTYSLKRKLDWYSTLAGRLGYAEGRTLFYGLGGLAWGKHKTTENVTGDDYVADFIEREKKTQLGWTAGLGVEHAINDRFAVRVEYAHIDFGGQKIDGGTEKVDLSADTFKIGASYKLTGEREPLR